MHGKHCESAPPGENVPTRQLAHVPLTPIVATPLPNAQTGRTHEMLVAAPRSTVPAPLGQAVGGAVPPAQKELTGHTGQPPLLLR
jgi:hypothetical protein